MGEISRGQDVTVQIFDGDGELVLSLQPTSFDRNMDSDEERQKRLGSRSEKPRQVLHGWSGTATFEEEGPVMDELVDLLQERYLNADAHLTIDILETTFYPETATEKSYVYPDAVFKINRSVADKDSPTEQTLEWTSDFRREV